MAVPPLFASAAVMRGRLRAAFAIQGPARRLVDDPLRIVKLAKTLGIPADLLAGLQSDGAAADSPGIISRRLVNASRQGRVVPML
jgi:hypothetical protein